MKVGVIVPIHGPFKGPHYTAPSYSTVKSIYQTAEGVGLDSAWITDHLLFRFPPENINIHSHEAFTFWGGVAEATSRIELGSLVLCMPFRNPAMMAKLAVSLNEVSNDRITFGVGCGWHEPEFKAFGYPFTNLVSKFEEAMQILHPLLREGKVDFHGTYYEASNCELCPPDTRPGGIPILIASHQPRMMEITARFADQWNGAWFGDVQTYNDRVALLNAACGRVGRDPKSIVKTAGVAINFQDSVPTDDSYDPKTVIAGPVEHVAEKLAEYAQADCQHLIANLTGLTDAKVEKLADAAKQAGLLA
jgi:alkanesulfonate monooxygenase SsuD/methylene tetrahydromethanopterin reductase-like flavin-dependent oxidoreductase (luciferase family)